MATKSKAEKKKTVATLTHEEASRKNIPTAEFQSVMHKAEQTPIRVAYQRRNRDLDPQLVWRGKDEQDWSDLVTQAPPIYIQEKVHPKVLIDDLLRQSAGDRKAEDDQFDLFRQAARHRRQEVDPEGFVRLGANGGHFGHHLGVAHGGRSEAPEPPGL